MKIDRICYEQLWPTGVYANQRYRAEATIEPHEDIVECYKELQRKVEAAFTAMNPQIQWNPLILNANNGASITGEVLSETKTDPKEQQIQGFIQAIEMASGEKALRYFEKISETDPRIKEAFSNKLKSFGNANTK